MRNPSLPDRRRIKERRAKPTSPLSPSSLFGSRGHFRREEDRKKYRYVDLYSLRSVLTIFTTIILSLTDAIFTLRLVSLGAKEINPVMDFFLQFGPFPFLISKYLLTGSCLIWFLVHKNFTIWRGRIKVKTILIGVLILYLILIIYELILLFTLGV